jgi:hypothetical protein
MMRRDGKRGKGKVQRGKADMLKSCKRKWDGKAARPPDHRLLATDDGARKRKAETLKLVKRQRTTMHCA